MFTYSENRQTSGIIGSLYSYAGDTLYAAFCQNWGFAGAGPKDAVETHCSGSFARAY